MAALTVALWIAVPALGYLALLWSFDRHEREPWWALLTMCAAGALCAVVAGRLEMAIHQLSPYLHGLQTGDPSAAAWASFAVIAPIEEATKLIPVLIVARTSLLDEPVDGVVYAGATALGFAAWEGVLFAQEAQDHMTLAARAVLAMPGHLCFSALWGAGVGVAYFWGRRAFRWLPLTWLFAVAAHGLYDYLLLAERGAQRGGVVAVLACCAALAALGFRGLLDASPHRSQVSREGRCNVCGRGHRAGARFCAGCGGPLRVLDPGAPLLGLTPVLAAFGVSAILGGAGVALIAHGAGVGPASVLYAATHGQWGQLVLAVSVLCIASAAAGWAAARAGSPYAPLEAALGTGLAGAAGLLWLLLRAPSLLPSSLWAWPLSLLLAGSAAAWLRRWARR